ncbi:peptide-methionine (S)-S-oxide reductase MsrA [Dethiothermospora halolimnae]|uniref:peptide-methionine (S)-S-oxide reductase MsrA n=1 Tax=Dethiothermospora halolimnae TaxID=3114390 RepID=UPI003CCC1D8B
MKEIYLAGGCFWGVEAYMNTIDGVVETMVGYANGHVENPTYRQVTTSATGHAETCYIKYDESIISLEELLNKFWKVIDPTVKDRQGPDFGSHYRTGIYYVDDDDLNTILKSKEKQQTNYKDPIVTEIEPLKNFYKAEEYHQNYLRKNPGGYCHIKF